MSEESAGLARTVNWKQGMFIALGVPLLIVPSLYDVEQLVWGLCIVVWTVSVLQGFVQNLAYGEMVTLFPNATGLPGCAQAVFTKDNNNGGIDKGKLIGAFSAWCYWFAWCPVVAIFTMMIGDYLVAMFSIDWTGWTLLGLYMLVGIIVVLIMYILSARGLEGGATVGTILALISMIPIIIILIGGLAAGMFDFSTITSEFTSPDWTWSGSEIAVVLGCFGLAQWSACAWETAAIYGPEYKEPGKDVPKALFGCGIICLIMYFFVSTVVFGSLGHEGIADAGYATLRPIAETAFGEYGSYIALFFLIVAMLLVIQGKLSVGYTMSLTQLLGGVMFPFEVLPGYWMALQTGKRLYRSNLEQLQNGLDTPGVQLLPHSPRQLALHGISFAYPNRPPLVEHLTLHLDCTKKYALVGGSGSGKSTLAKLLLGFLTPTRGSVTLDGIPLNQVEAGSLYHAIGYQSQNNTFFRDTLEHNILLGRSLSPEDWKQLLQQVQLAHWVSQLPHQAQTFVEENGKNLSGGQAQRVALARCLAGHPAFLVLDEITSALDPKTAGALMNTVLALEGVGLLAITHDLSGEWLKRFDSILVLRNGSVTEQGSWEELMSQRGELYHLSTRT